MSDVCAPPLRHPGEQQREVLLPACGPDASRSEPRGIVISCRRADAPRILSVAASPERWRSAPSDPTDSPSRSVRSPLRTSLPAVRSGPLCRRLPIWTPDAGRAMALFGNTPDAYGQTWHLPVDPHRRTYAEMIQMAQEVTGRRIPYTVLPLALFTVGAASSARSGRSGNCCRATAATTSSTPPSSPGASPASPSPPTTTESPNSSADAPSPAVQRGAAPVVEDVPGIRHTPTPVQRRGGRRGQGAASAKTVLWPPKPREWLSARRTGWR